MQTLRTVRKMSAHFGFLVPGSSKLKQDKLSRILSGTSVMIWKAEFLAVMENDMPFSSEEGGEMGAWARAPANGVKASGLLCDLFPEMLLWISFISHNDAGWKSRRVYAREEG